MIRLRPCLAVVAVLAALASMAHVGSPDTFFAGAAGPYPLQVAVRLPGVIPGLAQITVRVDPARAGTVTRVTARAIQWNVGPEGAPPADVLQPVPGDPGHYAASLWFMAATSYRIQVAVDGAEGRGEAMVPVMAIATAQREMPRGLGLLLAGLGLFLAAGLLTIVRAAVREGALPPGATVDPARNRQAWKVSIAWAIVLVVAILGGRWWWSAEAAAYGRVVLFKPFPSRASVATVDGARRLTLTIDHPQWPPRGNGLTRYNALLADHGKLMHMFLVKEDDAGVFAHLHPVPRQPPAAFDATLPDLPAGRYRVYGDIVHESGYAQTLVSGIDLPPPSGGAAAGDADDSWFSGAAANAATQTFTLADGTTMVWEREKAGVVAGGEQLLRFTVRDASGAPAPLEPYMGMLGHVIVTRLDGAVFAHLHPSGSVSMAALQRFAGPGGVHEGHAPLPAGEVSTLYAFPLPGRYRMWVQVKRAGQVLTGAFDVDVTP